MKAIAANACQSISNHFDRFLNEIDFMQESLMDRGVMANPEHTKIAIVDAMETVGPEMRKEMIRITRKITEIQSLARQLEDMDDVGRGE